jgi:hypothetical protein
VQFGGGNREFMTLWGGGFTSLISFSFAPFGFDSLQILPVSLPCEITKITTLFLVQREMKKVRVSITSLLTTIAS